MVDKVTPPEGAPASDGGSNWMGPEGARLLAAFLPIPFVFYDVAGRVVFLNDAFTQLYGWTLDDLIGQRIDFVPEHELQRTAEVTGRALAGERVAVATQRFTKSGRQVQVLVRTAALADPDGEVRGVYVLHEEITQVRAMEDALAETEHRYRQLLDASPDPITVYDAAGGVEYINPAFTETFGWTLDELCGRGIDFVPASAAEDTRDAVTKMVAGEPVLLETQRLTKDGRILDINLKTRSFFAAGGDLAGNVVIYRDSTDRRRVEAELENHRIRLEEEVAARTAELRKSNRHLKEEVAEHRRTQKALLENEERFRELAELLPEIVFEMDAEGRITFVNRRGLEVTGYAEADLTGEGFRALDLLVEEDRARASRNLELVSRGESTPRNEYTGIRKDGSRFPLMAFSSPILRDGVVRGFRGIIVDTSRAKLLEEQLRHAAKMEAVGTLAGGVAHDFNNILQAIGGYVQLLLEDHSDPATRGEMLTQIGRAADRAGDLVKSLLTFSRSEAARPAAVDLNRVVREAVSLLERTIPKMVHIQLDLMAGLETAWIDPNQLTQVLMNLGTNARDAMPQGGTLSITTGRAFLAQGFTAEHPETCPGTYLCLAVADTGEGMEGDQVAQVFDPFFTTKEVGKGTGLGLSTAYGIVKAHDGHIMCDSVPGKGTRFTIYLPQSAAAEAAADFRGDAELDLEPQRGDETLLLVEDEPDVRDLGRAILERYGYQVLEANSGEAALAMYQERGSEIDLVLLDLGMPGMGGTHCLGRLLHLDPEARVVVASGYNYHQYAEEVLQTGARGFVSKPYRMVDLVGTVRRVLDGKGET